MNALDILLWVIVPYVSLAIFVVGHYWRYKYDKFGWTTRSSQLYERRLLRWGSPLFHFGILFALGGHVIGLGIPESWTAAVHDSGMPRPMTCPPSANRIPKWNSGLPHLRSLRS